MATGPRFNGQLMADDIALRGWKPSELARRANVADMTVYRFLSGEVQTAPVAKRLAKALGKPLSRYLIPSSESAVTQ
jgi:transcriptional regulator with XRE-family HTH domain